MPDLFCPVHSVKLYDTGSVARCFQPGCRYTARGPETPLDGSQYERYAFDWDD